METQEVEKRGFSYKKIIGILILLILIHLTLILSRISVTREEYVDEEVSHEITETYNGEEPVVVEECYMREFNYEYFWEGWIEEMGGFISPKLRVANAEDQIGEFKVHFAFFDMARFPFEEYQGKNYELVKEKLSWNDAAMHSKTVTQSIGHYGNVLITIATKKKEEGAVYWVYADIEAPKIRECNSTTIYENKIKNRTITNYRMERVKKNVTNTLSLWDILITSISRIS